MRAIDLDLEFKQIILRLENLFYEAERAMIESPDDYTTTKTKTLLRRIELALNILELENTND